MKSGLKRARRLIEPLVSEVRVLLSEPTAVSNVRVAEEKLKRAYRRAVGKR